jgi:aryl-alcohol dehydrogenase-like predicted oxidoreductase
VTSVVVGAETEEQLRANAKLVDREPLTDDGREHVLASLPPELPLEFLDPSRWSK